MGLKSKIDNGIDTVKSYQFPSLRIKETISNYVSLTDTF